MSDSRYEKLSYLYIFITECLESSPHVSICVIVEEFVADDWLLENMRKKAALERLQLENPGFDLSGAENTGNYATGGPDDPS